MPGPSTRTASASSASASRIEEDEELRPYVVVGDIGKGSFATVYKGYHEDNHQSVAIKTVLHGRNSPRNYSRACRKFSNPSRTGRHITKLIDIVRTDRNIYLSMGYCSGGDLANYIKKRGRVETLEYVLSEGAAPQYYPHPRTGGLDEIVVRSFLRQLARALKFLLRGRPVWGLCPCPSSLVQYAPCIALLHAELADVRNLAGILILLREGGGAARKSRDMHSRLREFSFLHPHPCALYTPGRCRSLAGWTSDEWVGAYTDGRLSSHFTLYFITIASIFLPNISARAQCLHAPPA
ncbi:kinase-like domain-containing protein [Mycena olivaceomarginata]|nr:kinase-like domain-containing protein [Mycena olivaceomarginata]